MNLKNIFISLLLAALLFLILPVKYIPLTCDSSEPGLQDCRFVAGPSHYRPFFLAYKDYKNQNLAGLHVPQGVGLSRSSLIISAIGSILVTGLITYARMKKA